MLNEYADLSDGRRLRVGLSCKRIPRVRFLPNHFSNLSRWALRVPLRSHDAVGLHSGSFLLFHKVNAPFPTNPLCRSECAFPIIRVSLLLLIQTRGRVGLSSSSAGCSFNPSSELLYGGFTLGGLNSASFYANSFQFRSTLPNQSKESAPTPLRALYPLSYILSAHFPLRSQSASFPIKTARHESRSNEPFLPIHEECALFYQSQKISNRALSSQSHKISNHGLSSQSVKTASFPTALLESQDQSLLLSVSFRGNPFKVSNCALSSQSTQTTLRLFLMLSYSIHSDCTAPFSYGSVTQSTLTAPFLPALLESRAFF